MSFSHARTKAGVAHRPTDSNDSAIRTHEVLRVCQQTLSTQTKSFLGVATLSLRTSTYPQAGRENTNECLKRERDLCVAAAILPLAARMSTYKRFSNF